MSDWLTKKSVVGYTAVIAAADGLYGVTVLPSLTMEGKPRVVKCYSIPGGRLDVETLTALSKNVSVAGCPWVLSLGHKTYKLLVVPEPQVQPSELAESVRWSIGAMLDHPVDEGRLAVMQIPTAEQLPNRTPNLYVVFASNEVIAGCNAVFQQSGIPLEAIDIRETAQRNIAALAEKNGEGLGLLLADKHGVQFTITYNGELYLDRFIEESVSDQPSSDADAEERAYERIVLQMQRSLDFIGRVQTFIDVKRILVMAMPGQRVYNSKALSEQLQKPVEALDLSSLFDFSNVPELAEKEKQLAYFSVLGAALRFMGASQQINLQPPRKPTGVAAVWREFAILGLVLLSLLGVWGVQQMDVVSEREAEAASVRQLQEANNRLQGLMGHANLASEIATLKPRAEMAQKMLAQTSNLGSPQGYAHQFSLLASIAEEGLWLSEVSVGATGKTIHLSGRALNKDLVLRYAQQLNSRFAGSGVQFTSLVLTAESTAAQGKPGAPLTTVAFQLY